MLMPLVVLSLIILIVSVFTSDKNLLIVGLVLYWPALIYLNMTPKFAGLLYIILIAQIPTFYYIFGKNKKNFILVNSIIWAAVYFLIIIKIYSNIF
ncbi:hypothetical protein [Desulfitibacter alkalitolerans]|uniref:hypothetical protein n=1 Tax=Desulfitibacter alkalitolerans TaxID=264641 RepID=UPI00048A0D14|nr:hypothetical protein [Desulfitibacter alkalitolerans]